MQDVPHLSSTDLRADLQEAYKQRRQHHLFAFFGTGEPQTLSLEGGDVRVVPVRSELELRESLPMLMSEENVRMAFLVPWMHDIPIDIAGRFAFNGRVRRIGKEARLRALFSVAEIDDDIRKSSLGEYLLRPGNSGQYNAGEARLTSDALWLTWLKADWNLQTRGGLAIDVLLDFIATDANGPTFVKAMSDAAAGQTRDELLSWMSSRLGPVGPALWKAWEEDRGRQAVQMALLCEALSKNVSGSVRMWLSVKMRDALKVSEADTWPVADALAREVAGAMRLLERRVPTHELRLLAREADELVVEPEVRTALADSTRLPSAWALRLERLGTVLSKGAGELTPATVLEAAQGLRALDAHVFFKDKEEEPRLKRAEMAVRLLSWLVLRPDKAISAGHAPYGEAEALGHWYAQEGGYVDRARRAARGTDGDAFGRGVQAVVAAADLARTLLDRAFAQSLASWIEAGQPSTQVLPIHDAVKRIAVRFLEGDERRRLLVLLMDGMAWAQAVELLESLGQRAAPWAPLAWHDAKENRIGESSRPVVFAALPTVTEVSRSSFFAGKLFGPGAKLTTPDPKHWEQHAQVKKLVAATDVPKLLLRGEGHTKAGGASSEALALVGDPDRRIVALVLNAIDDSLKASHAVRHSWGVENIASLGDLLDKAREEGRSVLLASDHGHIPADRVQRTTAATPALGARWRSLPTLDAPIASNEVLFSGSRVYVPPGAAAIALLADDASAYVGSTHAGEHGGATLAEVVAPCLLIGCADNLDGVRGDAGLEVHAARVPRWWHFDVAEHEVVEVPVQVPAAKPKRNDQQRNDAQMVLLPSVAPPPVISIKASAPPTSNFSTSEILKVRVKAPADRQHVVEAVDLLLARQGVMSGEAFAAAMRVLPFRVGGLIARLQEVLNLDGYEVIRFDPVTRQVELNPHKLGQLFEVEL